MWQRYANEAALRALLLADESCPALNVTGPETVSVKQAAKKLAGLLGKEVTFGEETGDKGILCNSQKCMGTFGYPDVSLDEMMRMQAEWILEGGRTLNKPTHYADILVAMAPKPVAVLSNRHDFFPREGTLRACEEAKRVWERLGKPGFPELVCAESEHAYGKTLACAALGFFNRSLLGTDVSAKLGKRFRFEPLKREELFAADGCIIKYKPNMRTLQREAEDMLKLIVSTPPVGGKALTDSVCALIGTDRVRPGKIRVYREGICAPYAYSCVIFRCEPGIWLNGVLLRDMRSGDGPLPTRLYANSMGTVVSTRMAMRVCSEGIFLSSAMPSGEDARDELFFMKSICCCMRVSMV